jgi:class 3 adenylate cyclase
MQTVRQWLDQLGLPQYAEAFERNQVDLDLIRELRDDDLEKVGVLPLGHRKKLLKAIGELNAGLPPALASPARPEHSPAQQPAHAEAERRQLTVLFCDLVGSTALAQKLDPEELRDLMQAYQRACGEIIARYDGHVAQYLGDGLMVYFGWPRAHEDDAERAVRASLDVVDVVKSVPAAAPLQVRIGIATGPVVVGETGAGDASVPKVAVGETPNLAARLQGLAGPNEIVVGLTTQRLLGTSFEYRDLGQHLLKGIAEPIHTWRVLGTASVEGRFEATREAGALTPLVGREEEIRLLLNRWEQTKAGEGQVVLLCGEPGVGKSRILQVLRERIARESQTRLRFQCSPFRLLRKSSG